MEDPGQHRLERESCRAVQWQLQGPGSPAGYGWVCFMYVFRRLGFPALTNNWLHDLLCSLHSDVTALRYLKTTFHLHSAPLSKSHIHIKLPHHDYPSIQFWEFSFVHWIVHSCVKGFAAFRHFRGQKLQTSGHCLWMDRFAPWGRLCLISSPWFSRVWILQPWLCPSGVQASWCF